MSSGALERRASAEEAGTRLDVALAGLAEVGSRAEAERLIQAGHVRVEGVLRPKRHRLRAGDLIEVEPRVLEPVASPGAGEGVPHDIVLEDEHLLVVDKPAGVVVHPAPGHPAGTLAQALADRSAGGKDPWRPGIVHRLDRDTSGLLVVAKSPSVHRALQEAIRRREVRREYLALVEGRPSSRSGTIDAPLGRDRLDRTAVSIRTDHPRGARTHFELEEALAGTSLLRVTLETGRTHQIRAHLSAIGHALCGDPRYGGGATGARIGLERQFLHAGRLAFAHPVTAEALDCRSELPEDLADALRAARSGAAGTEGR